MIRLLLAAALLFPIPAAAQSLGIGCVMVEHPELLDEYEPMLSASAATRLMLAVAKETQSQSMTVGGAVVLRGSDIVAVFWRRGDALCRAYYPPVPFERAYRAVFGIEG